MSHVAQPSLPSAELSCWRRFARGKVLAYASFGVLGLLVVVALFAPWIAPQDPNSVDLSASLAGPSAQHLLGADEAGRDILSRVIWGARTSLLGPLVVVFASTFFGAIVGIWSAWRGGWLDNTLSRINDAMLAFPGLLLAILMVALVGPGLTAPVIALAVAYTPYVARVTRGVAVLERNRPYMDALKTAGFGGLAVCVRHLFPNIAPFILAQAAILFGYALIDLAALSYLGFGVQPPTADWGSMISQGQFALLQGAPMSSVAPGVVIVITVVAFNLAGESIADRVRGRGC